MSRKSDKTKRFFTNEYPDYSGGSVKISAKEWKEKVIRTVELIKSKQDFKDNGGGLYTGVAGIAYMFYHVSQLPVFEAESHDYLAYGLKYINAALAYIKTSAGDKMKESGFLVGHSGIYAVACVLNNAAGNRVETQKFLQSFINAVGDAMPMLSQGSTQGSDEMLVGRAGYLAGALWLRSVLGDTAIPNTIFLDVAAAIIRSGRDYAQENRSPCPLMYAYHGREYLGAAHGLSFILQMLLSVPESFQLDPDVEKDVRASVDYLCDVQAKSGNFPSAVREKLSENPDPDELLQWCHGAPGVVFLMANAYNHWHNEKYLRACISSAEIVWERGLLQKGPGICHGVAGSGYVFLMMYRLLEEEKYLYRAQQFARFMYTPKFEKEARTPDNPYSLFEGLAGTACFLADLTKPRESSFPFMNISF